MLFPYKAIFVDLDGTLLNSQKTLSPKTLTCLNYFVQLGVHVVIATGRSIKSVRKVTENLSLNTPVITLNGCDIRSKIDGYSMKISYLENALRDRILNFCKHAITQFEIKSILVDTGSNFFVSDLHSIDLEEFLNHYDNPPQILNFDTPMNESVVSFLFLLEPTASREEFIRAQKELLPLDTKVCTFNGWPWIEIGSPHTHKGAAMEFVCAQLGITCQEVIAFGDGENDVEMLQMAGLGVAMANADSHALQAAKEVTLSHDEDGVVYFLEKLSQSH